MDVVQTFCMGSSPTMMKHVDTTHTNDETCHVDLNPQKHGMKLWFTDVGYPKIFASHPSCGPKSLAPYSRSTTPMALQDAASPSWLSILMGGIPAIKTWVLCYWFTLWKTNSLLWKITIFNGKIHYKWPFSIAMLVCLPEGIYDGFYTGPDPRRVLGGFFVTTQPCQWVPWVSTLGSCTRLGCDQFWERTTKQVPKNLSINKS